jgi:hypothetical protein
VPLRTPDREQPRRRHPRPRQSPNFARHPRTDSGPIETDTIERATEQLDLALAISEVYSSDPSFAAPRDVWDRLQSACPDLLR